MANNLQQESAATAEMFFDDLLRCEIRLYNGLDARLRERHGLSTAQLGLLRYIGENPGCRVVDLAASFAVGVGAFSKAVDRSARLGWVRRAPNPEDRRSSLLYLTPEGSQLMKEAESTFAGYLTELVGKALTPDRLGQAAASLSALRGSLEQDRVGVPTG